MNGFTPQGADTVVPELIVICLVIFGWIVLACGYARSLRPVGPVPLELAKSAGIALVVISLLYMWHLFVSPVERMARIELLPGAFFGAGAGVEWCRFLLKCHRQKRIRACEN